VLHELQVQVLPLPYKVIHVTIAGQQMVDCSELMHLALVKLFSKEPQILIGFLQVPLVASPT